MNGRFVYKLHGKGGRMNDRDIVASFFERRESALTAVSDKYSRLYISILRETLSDERDIEECANDVLLALWDSIPPNAPSDLASYVCKIARRIGIDKYRYNSREKRGGGYTLMLSELEESVPDPSPDANIGITCDSEITREAIGTFIKSLDTETRVLFVRRYFYFESTKALADRFGMSENVVSVRLFRARKKLKKILEKEGIYV